jgi:hypothetical protein
MKTRLTLYERLKPEYKQMIKESNTEYPSIYENIVKELSEAYYWIDIRYGTAHDIMSPCELSFLGDAFNREYYE